jgi:hypothetical protein
MQTPIHLYDERHRTGLVGLVPAAVLADDQAADAPVEVTWETGRPEAGVCWARAEVGNVGDRPVAVKGFRWQADPRAGAGPALHFPLALRPHVYATENLRGDYFGTGTVESDRFFYPLDNRPVEFGGSEDHLFPGVFVFAAGAPVGLLVAQASQERLNAFFRFRGRMERQDKWLFEIEERVIGIGSLTLAPGQRLRGEKLFFHLAGANDPQRVTGAYYRLLQADGVFARRAQNPLPAQRIYCTWNYDFFADIDQEKLLAQLPVIRRSLPRVKFVQLDDGYQACHAPGQRAMIDLCYGDLEYPFDRTRFPDGPKALADRVKAAGLRPAIWLGLWASTGSRMLKDHPDWVLRDDTGMALIFDKWYGGTAILDPSVPGVRDYLDRMCRIVFGEWGYEGVKLDFSSFAFNAKRVRYRFPGKSAVERRHELEAIFRRHLPADGFFGWCVVAGTAQPFLNQADYFRNAIDINKGDWPTVKRVAMWTANTNMLLQERPCLPNLDSIGWSEEFDEVNWQTWLNFAAVAGGALEVSGDLRKLDEARLARLARTLELSDPVRRVYCLDVPPGEAAHPPALWLAEGADGSRLLGVFNWSDAPATVMLSHPDLAALRDGWRDPWDRRAHGCRDLPGSAELPPRGSLLLARAARR